MNLAFDPARSVAAGTPLPGSLRVNRKLSQWLKFHRDGYVEAFSGKVEIGQGIITALAQIVAEELDVSLVNVRMVAASTAHSPDEAITSGSRSIEESGAALRYACAEARAIYLQAAATKLGVPVDSLSIVDGNIVAGNSARTSYWALADDVLLEREASGRIAPKAVDVQHIVGTSVPRLDLPDKVFGAACFIHDVELEGMLHGRMLRPPSPGATLEHLDETDARTVAGLVDIVCDGSLVGVLAESEPAADAALRKLSSGARWQEMSGLPDENALGAWLKEQERETSFVAGNASGMLPAAPRTIRATYSRPYLAHASIGPSCALAHWRDSQLHVWTHSQGIFNLRRDLMLAFPGAEIVVEHVQGAGCYGHNGADDAGFDAAWLARAAGGRPVRVQWSRADELAWAPFGPAMAVDIEADIAADGAIVGWRHTIWSNGHTSRPGRASEPTLLGGWHLAHPFERKPSINPPLAGGGGADRNAIPIYAFPNWQMVNHRLLASPLRTSSLRSLGAFANVFAIESFMEELAIAAGENPIGFRLRHLADRRARAVIERAAIVAGWNQWVKREGTGHGIGFARYKNAGAYCAVIAEIEAQAEVRVLRLIVAVDAGRVINPDGAAHQIEGGAIQATSWTLKEAVRFDHTRVTSDRWENYPILRFSEVPQVQVEIVPRSDCASVGVGEAAQGPTAAAIANALFDALGVRVRDLPFTIERIRDAIRAAI